MAGPMDDGSDRFMSMMTRPIRVPIIAPGRAEVAHFLQDFLIALLLDQGRFLFDAQQVVNIRGLVAVGDQLEGQGDERIVDLDLFQSNAAALAGRLGAFDQDLLTVLAKSTLCPLNRPINDNMPPMTALREKAIRVEATVPPTTIRTLDTLMKAPSSPVRRMEPNTRAIA